MSDLNYRCDRCDFSVFTTFLPRVYSLGDERQVSMEQRHFWCSACDQFSVCESLDPDPDACESVEEQLQEWRAFLDTPIEKRALLPRHMQHDSERVAKWMAEFEAAGRDWEEWRSRRTAPPKCLKCGAPVADVPATRYGEFGHGLCGGTVRCGFRIVSACGGFETFPHVYDVDGNLVEQGRVPVKRVYDPYPRPEYGPLELFHQPLDHDPCEAIEKLMREEDAR